MDRTAVRVAFLKARLDEDEQIAHGGEGACWHVDYCDEDGPVFMARFDSARALREVEFKRRLLDEVVLILNDLDAIASSEGQAPKHPLRKGEYLDEDGDPTAYLLELLAEPYSGHEDYASLFAERVSR